MEEKNGTIEAEELREERKTAEEADVQESAAEGAEETAESLGDLQKRFAEADAQAQDFKRRLYSVTAEYENYRKRTAATRAQSYAEGRADVVIKLFPIADNLERALVSAADEKTKAGIQMVVKSFEKLLEEEKITPIDPLGEPFDAEKCEAIMALDPEEGEESGTVKQVYLKGYEQNGKVLRFAQVVVTK